MVDDDVVVADVDHDDVVVPMQMNPMTMVSDDFGCRGTRFFPCRQPEDQSDVC